MIVTDRQKNNLIKQYTWIVRQKTHKYKYKLDPRDYEELFSDCLYAINKAIDNHDESSGFAVGTLIRRCISQAISRWFRNYCNDKHRDYRDNTIYAETDVLDENGVDVDLDSALTVNILYKKAIISNSDWFILTKNAEGFTNDEVAAMMGKAKITVAKHGRQARKRLKEYV